MAPLLEVSDLHAGYGASPVLFGVSLGIARGEVVALLGRNGMGKTTTVRAIMGLLRPTAGAILRAASRSTAVRAIRSRAPASASYPKAARSSPISRSRRTSSRRPAAGAEAPPGRLPRVYELSASCASAGAISAASSPAASSRCWRSAAR